MGHDFELDRSCGSVNIGQVDSKYASQDAVLCHFPAMRRTAGISDM
jgi:hypothetical protein